METALRDLGWKSPDSQFYINHLKEDSVGRIGAVHKNMFSLLTNQGEIQARLAGKMVHHDDFPAVGDWVVFTRTNHGEPVVIQEVISRVNYLSRKISGKSVREQIIAANIDLAFIVQALDATFNIRRLERYIAITGQRGIRSVVLLNKHDLYSEERPVSERLGRISETLDIHAVSCKTGYGMNGVKSYFDTGTTACFLGSSGVGKSSIINYLIGADKQKVREVRTGDSKGKHTTTTRQLLRLPGEGLVIDTPGMRELQIWEEPSQIDASFHDIEEFSRLCRFKNCAHEGEPGCHVLRSVEDGILDVDRLNSYKKLKSETEYLRSLTSTKTYQERKRSQKKFSRYARMVNKTGKRKY